VQAAVTATDDRGSKRKSAGRVSSVIALLSCAGIVVSSVSLYHHYGMSKSSFCDFGNSFNCDMVNRSIYSTVAGVPIALLGVLGYAVLLCLSSIYRTKAETPVMLLIASVVGLVFALYLTYIEAFVLATWCVLCLSSLALIMLIAGFSALLVMKGT
jgi:vitamin-K-epoxide reductase (warfarin-sensitive)